MSIVFLFIPTVSQDVWKNLYRERFQHCALCTSLGTGSPSAFFSYRTSITNVSGAATDGTSCSGGTTRGTSCSGAATVGTSCHCSVT